MIRAFDMRNVFFVDCFGLLAAPCVLSAALLQQIPDRCKRRACEHARARSQILWFEHANKRYKVF